MDSGPWLSASGANLVNWLQSSPLPGADENSPYSPSVSGTSALLIMRHIHVFCIWTRQRLPNSWTLAGPRSQESGPAPFSPGRGSHEGWKEPLLYRLILLWISCLFRPQITPNAFRVKSQILSAVYQGRQSGTLRVSKLVLNSSLPHLFCSRHSW